MAYKSPLTTRSAVTNSEKLNHDMQWHVFDTLVVLFTSLLTMAQDEKDEKKKNKLKKVPAPSFSVAANPDRIDFGEVDPRI